MQENFNNVQAQALAEFIESSQEVDFNRFATKDDFKSFATKDDLKDLELRLVKDASKTREDLSKEIAKAREDMITRTNWSTIIHVITTVGALVALAKIL